jgi:hypothetical protein
VKKKGIIMDEEFIEEVLKTELGDNLEKLEDGVAVGLIDFTKDSEYIRLYNRESANEREN